MNIGVDIDGILTDFYTWVLDNGNKYFHESGFTLDFRINEYNPGCLINLKNDDYNKFWDDMFVVYLKNVRVRDFASEVIDKLRSEGNKVYIITARNESDSTKINQRQIEAITKKWLKKNKIKHDGLFFSSGSKTDIIKELNVSLMIDDQVNNIKSISEVVPVICINTMYNKDIKLDNLYRCYSWYHIYETIKGLDF